MPGLGQGPLSFERGVQESQDVYPGLLAHRLIADHDGFSPWTQRRDPQNVLHLARRTIEIDIGKTDHVLRAELRHRVRRKPPARFWSQRALTD